MSYVYVGCEMNIYSDDQGNFLGLVFQDKMMKDVFNTYPELIFVDATYKLLNIGVPTFLFLSEDSNGQSEISAACLLVSEDSRSIKWMVETFKHCNSRWDI